MTGVKMELHILAPCARCHYHGNHALGPDYGCYEMAECVSLDGSRVSVGTKVEEQVLVLVAIAKNGAHCATVQSQMS